MNVIGVGFLKDSQGKSLWPIRMSTELLLSFCSKSKAQLLAIYKLFVGPRWAGICL